MLAMRVSNFLILKELGLQLVEDTALYRRAADAVLLVTNIISHRLCPLSCAVMS